jgi:Ca2+-binding RTX toxin-like protein
MRESTKNWFVSSGSFIEVSDEVGVGHFYEFENIKFGQGDDRLTILNETAIKDFALSSGSDTIIVSHFSDSITIDGDAPDNIDLNNVFTDSVVFEENNVLKFEVDANQGVLVSRDTFNQIFLRNIEHILSNEVSFSFREDVDNGTILDFFWSEDRVLFRSTGVVETITRSGNSDWVYSGPKVTLIGVDLVIGTENADNLQGVQGLHLNAGGGNDYVNMYGADEATLGAGSDILAWNYGQVNLRSSWDRQIVHDFKSEDTLIIDGMTAMNVSFTDTNEGNLVAHTQGRTLLLEGVTSQDVIQNTLFKDGSMWVGTNMDDQRNVSTSNSSQKMYGLRGRDELTGSTAADTLYGGQDNDWVYGGSGNDNLYGDEGDDYIIGGGGADRLYGYECY